MAIFLVRCKEGNKTILKLYFMLEILSLFDGMGCGAIALTELKIPFKLYASEIDQHAIKQSKLNFPDMIHLGDVTKWREWDIDWKSINLVLAGSPCQGFSFAGKQLAFDDPRSKLFFVFVEILNHIKKLNPDVKFLLENVNMKKEYLRVISEYVGVFPVNINSNLVSAQNRDRWYWTNIKTKKVGLFDELYVDIPQPKDRGILLKDILESEVDEKYFLSDKMSLWLDKHDKKSKENGNVFSLNIRNGEEKTGCLSSGQYKQNLSADFVCVAMRGRNPENPSDRKTGIPTEQRLEPKIDGKTNCLTSVSKDNLIMIKRGHGFNDGGEVAKEGKTPPLTKSSWEQNNLIMLGLLSGGKWDNTHEQNKRVYSAEGKMQTLQTMGGGNQHPKTMQQSRIRRLTPTECARLQTIPEWYLWECSDTQIYRMCGNGWTVEVIKHILSFLNINHYEQTNS